MGKDPYQRVVKMGKDPYEMSALRSAVFRDLGIGPESVSTRARSLVRGSEHRIAVVVALAALGGIAVALTSGHEGLADELAMLAYVSAAVGVAVAVIRLAGWGRERTTLDQRQSDDGTPGMGG
jgi:hypothetical protein